MLFHWKSLNCGHIQDCGDLTFGAQVPLFRQRCIHEFKHVRDHGKLALVILWLSSFLSSGRLLSLTWLLFR